jgi:hypothetical protein
VRHRGWIAAALAAVVLPVAGCGGDGTVAALPPEPTAAAPPVVTRPAADGEIVVRGELTPTSHGPYVFDGRYRLTFAQHAPEDPELDFTQETSLVARLDRRAGVHGPGSIDLVADSVATGTRTLRIRGRYWVDVDFGDWPYVLRFAPVP